MRLIVDQSLAADFIPNNAWRQRASLPFKPGGLERKVYNNDHIAFFDVLTLAKPECDNVSRLANVNTRKIMFYPPIVARLD